MESKQIGNIESLAKMTTENSRKSYQSANFRQDVNGLRAWAVSAVILYHFGVSGFKGGFVGVDIFFVISGFLMTGIIVKSLQQGHFSLFEFYLSRARRILPALLALCMALTAVGWLVLPPSDFSILSQHVVTSLGFYSNIGFWNEAGYFDTVSHDKWLLHTWSLSVEWQFYMLLPVLLWATWKIKPGRGAQTVVVFIGIVLSLTLSIFITMSNQSTAFYWLHTRAWEMLGGGLVYLYANSLQPTANQSRWLAYIGLLLIAGSIYALNSESLWPGWRAVIPVLAAMMVIAASNRSFLTDNKVAQWIGDRSYSLYLWHWPVYVGLVYIGLHNDVLAITASLLGTAIISHLSFTWVENPARRKLTITSPGASVALMASSVAVVLVAAFLVIGSDGFPGRLPKLVELAAAESSNVHPLRQECHVDRGETSPSCVHGGQKWGVILLGDSHANAIVSALATANPDSNTGVVEWSYSGCPSIPGIKPLPHKLARFGEGWKCTQFTNWTYDQLGSLPETIPVVLVARYANAAMGYNDGNKNINKPDWFFTRIHLTTTPDFLSEFSNNIVKSACELAKHRTVYMVRPIPEMGVDIPKALSRRMAMGNYNDITIPIADYRYRNDWVWHAQDLAREQCGVKILDPTEYLCNTTHCFGSRNGRPLYSDDDHLSEFGNKALVPMFGVLYQYHTHHAAKSAQ